MCGAWVVLGGGITRWKENDIQIRLTAERPTVLLQAQELAVEGKEMRSEISRAARHSDELRGRLIRLIRKVGGCG